MPKVTGAVQAPVLAVAAQGVAHGRALCAVAGSMLGMGQRAQGLTGCRWMGPGCRLDAQQLHPVFVVGLHAVDHHVGPKALHAHGGMACRLEPGIEIVQRRHAGQQHRKAVAELVGHCTPLRPAQAGQAALRRVKAHQAAGLAQKGAEPVRRRVAHVPRVHLCLARPPPPGWRALHRRQRHARSSWPGACSTSRPRARSMPGAPAPCAAGCAGSESALVIDEHPGPVEFQTRLGQHGLLHLHARAGLDGVHKQARHGTATDRLGSQRSSQGPARLARRPQRGTSIATHTQRRSTPAHGPGRRSYNARMAQSFDICIRGAGVVGRTLALLLARERLSVALVANPAGPHGLRCAGLCPERGLAQPAGGLAYLARRRARHPGHAHGSGRATRMARGAL
jgi:hypothetical protein